MVVCRHFLQGNCKFGANCKFEHVYYSNTRGESNSIMLQQRNAATNPPVSKVDVATLLKSVQTDMLSAEKGGLWLFSSYSPFKEKPLYPGFEDVSPEEVRLGFYEAKSKQIIDRYEKILQSACLENQAKIRMLQNPTEEAIQRIQAIYNTPVRESAYNPFPSFGTTSSSQNSSFPLQPVEPQQAGNTFSHTNSLRAFNGGIFGDNSIPATQTAVPQGIFASNSFGSQPPANIMMAVTQANKPTTGPLFSQHSQPTGRNLSIFGGGDAAPARNPIAAGRITCTHYSQATDLTQEDTKQYKLDRFSLELVPIMPPSNNFCAG